VTPVDVVVGVVVAVVFLYGVYALVRDIRSRLERAREQRTPPQPAAPPVPVPASAVEVAPDVRGGVREDAAKLRVQLGDHPGREGLEESAHFARAVRRLEDQRLTIDELVALARDGDRWVSRIALSTLSDCSDLPSGWSAYVVRRLRQAPYDQAWLFLRTLERVPEPVVGAVLAQIEYVLHRDVAELIYARAQNGREVVNVDTLRDSVPMDLAAAVEALLDEWDVLIPEVRDAFDEWRATAVDAEFLDQFARTWKRPFDSPPALLVGSRSEVVELIYDTLARDPVESLLLIGEHGVGKTALVRAALERLPRSWLVFEATAASVNAGAIYVGELEGRVRQIVERMGGRSAVWILPDLEEALWAGRHTQSPTGLLDHLLPYLQAGDLRVVAEVTPSSYELIMAHRPQVGDVFKALRIRPLSEEDSVAIAAHALEHGDVGVDVSDDVLAESFELAQQFFPGTAPPGNVLRLLESAADAVAERGEQRVESSDVLETVARTTGLPLALLDASIDLDLDDVRAFFEERILGQPEAVECLVERIAMVKAGLTDPERPLGVFLFVGPTGTGKTEIVKALTEFLFGSTNRLIRLDMSEYQTPDSLERLLSDTSVEQQGAPLVASVRRDPFSVVLLDEFEKAAAPIWDVFLQVFDDGRLTDRHGRLVNLRRCVIVLTSNIGSAIVGGPGLGFDRAPEAFSPDSVLRAVGKSFRPEFLNRLDRTVVFRPFERDQMRALVERELRQASRLRGLRGRPWAIEYDESALEFLVEQGFSPEFGARPLKRAVERHVLTPLSVGIVGRTVPEGDQFLFVTASRDRLDFRFVDPDAEEAPLPEDGNGAGQRDLDVRALMLAPRSERSVALFLLDELHRIGVTIESESIFGRKQQQLEAISRPGFWEDDRRFEVLAEAEYLDRFEAAYETAERLGERLRAHAARNGSGSAELVDLLATRLYVLETALADVEGGAFTDLYVRLGAVGEPVGAETEEFVRTLAEMYARWGERRGMRVELVRRKGGETMLAVGGLGAASILAPETGLHMLEVVGEETREGDRPVDRVVVAVDIARQPVGGRHPGDEHVDAVFLGRSVPTEIVRRYRPGASPLVRDAVRGYRTGRLDRVLAGDFDLF
jgi:ATP-dependent Clp protease ATP-binding subunit ClpC